jgi:hypothetical protein
VLALGLRPALAHDAKFLPHTKVWGLLWQKRMKKEFQSEVEDWFIACFGEEAIADTATRTHRFLEEALELAQATGCSKDEASQLVDYVYSRPRGVVAQEVGGVSTTLAMLCTAFCLSLDYCANDELKQIWSHIEEIRRKDAAKPKGSPLPV